MSVQMPPEEVRILSRPVHNRVDHSDYSTFLAIDRNEIPADAEVDNPVTVALSKCRKTVVQPYRRLLQVIAWHPLTHHESWPARLCNALHLTVVICLILIGYVIQYAACFQQVPPFIEVNITDGANHTTIEHRPGDCRSRVISQYVIPSILHSAAYAYAFYLMRIVRCEQLDMLMETVFLQTTPNHTGYQSQGKLIKTLQWLLYAGIFWVILISVSQLLHVIAEYEKITFTWMAPHGMISSGLKGFLSLVMLISFVTLDMVYVCVVISYSVQCSLLIYYMRAHCEKVQEKTLPLEGAIRKIGHSEKFLHELNDKMSNATSLTIFNFATVIILEAVAVLNRDENKNFTPLMYFSIFFTIISWVLIMALPIVQACRLSGACNAIWKLGHEIRVRPYGYQETPQLDLDSFLNFTASLNMRAKLFRVPIRTSYIMLLGVIMSFTAVVAFQVGAIHVWLSK